MVVQLGQYHPGLLQGRLYDQMDVEVCYSDSPDWDEPVIAYVGERVNVDGTTATVKVEATDLSGILGGLVSYTIGDQQWRSTSLEYDATLAKWVGVIPATSSTLYYVQVVDNAGNVAAATNKGRYFSVYREPFVYLPMVVR
jgi:hypothetical protein